MQYLVKIKMLNEPGTNWNQDVGFTFCEGEFYRGQPVESIVEFANTVSSFILFAFGMLGLYGSLHSGILIQIMNSLLVLNGIGSILFHATMQFGWSLIDEIPMILMMQVGNTVIVDLVLRLFVKDRGYEKTYHFLATTNVLVYTFYGIFTVTLDATNSNPTLFRILFAAPYLVIVGGMLLIYFNRPNNVSNTVQNSPQLMQSYSPNSFYVKLSDPLVVDSQLELDVYSLVWFSIFTGVVGMICWMTDTLACNETISTLRLHAIWHILIAYSTHCQLSMAGYLRAKATGRQARLVWILKFIPLVRYH